MCVEVLGIAEVWLPHPQSSPAEPPAESLQPIASVPTQLDSIGSWAGISFFHWSELLWFLYTGFSRIDFHTTVAHPPSADILEGFETQHPLVLPDGGYQFQLGKEVTDSALWEELAKLQKFISTLSQSSELTIAQEKKVPMAEKYIFLPTKVCLKKKKKIAGCFHVVCSQKR